MKFIFVNNWTDKKSKDMVVSLTWFQLHFERSSFRSVKCFHALKPIFLLLRHTGDSYCLITSFAHKPYLFVAILPLVFANCFPHSTLRQKGHCRLFPVGAEILIYTHLKVLSWYSSLQEEKCIWQLNISFIFNKMIYSLHFKIAE